MARLNSLMLGFCLSALGGMATAAEPAASSSAASFTSSPAPAEYRPSMGDLMTMAVQPRHIKLGLAGQQKNWPYATYEISELRNAFNRIARTIPTYNNLDTASLVTAMIATQLTAVQDAIKAGDANEFKVSYAKLTQSCNACHQAQNHAFVAIKAPDERAYADQEFKAVR